jgi:hypothetical protein
VQYSYLPDWKRELLVGAFQTGDSVGQQLLKGAHLFLCLDGGAKDNTGSFGWVIATTTDLLWECCGIASGWFANSFPHSEGFGQLSHLVFIEAYLDYYQLQDLPPGIFKSPSSFSEWM